jgi:hypothetical protein
VPSVTALPDAYTAAFNMPLQMQSGGILANGSGAGPLQAQLASQAAHGTVTPNPDGSGSLDITANVRIVGTLTTTPDGSGTLVPAVWLTGTQGGVGFAAGGAD